MRKYFAISLVLVVFLTLACDKEKLEPVNIPIRLNAIWVENGYDQEISIFKKSNEFDSNKYGFQFMNNGKFIERKNTGWCGTPPISYTIYEGKWTILSDSLINIESQYWGGTMLFQIEIVSVNKNELKLRYKYENN